MDDLKWRMVVLFVALAIIACIWGTVTGITTHKQTETVLAAIERLDTVIGLHYTEAKKQLERHDTKPEWWQRDSKNNGMSAI